MDHGGATGISSAQVETYFHSSENMEEVEDESVQFVLTSPSGGGPYHDSVAREIYRVLKPDGVFLFNVGHIPQGSETWAKLEEAGGTRYLPLMPYVITRQILRAAPFILEEDLVMMRHYGMKPRRVIVNYEHFFMFTKTSEWKFRTEKIGMFSAFALPMPEPPKQMPTTFDEGLLREFLTVFTDPGDTVLDPFAGTGTLGKVAIENNRRAILYEINPDLRDVISMKLAEAKTRIFAT